MVSVSRDLWFFGEESREEANEEGAVTRIDGIGAEPVEEEITEELLLEEED